MTSTPGAVAARSLSVDELKRAWHAVSEGVFRPVGAGPTASRRARTAGEWAPAESEQTVAIVGCVGSAGASTVALSAALSAALAAPGPVRVIECCSASASGLASAATAELGVDPSGWSQGRRGRVLLERASEILAVVDDIPLPTVADPGTLTFLDVGWEVGQLHAGASWLTDAVSDADLLVLVTTATTPGMRRLGVALDLLTESGPDLDRIVVAVRGPRRRKWGRGVEHAAGPLFQRVLAFGALTEIPECRDIAVTGLNSRPVPPPLVSAAGQMFAHLGRSSSAP